MTNDNRVSCLCLTYGRPQLLKEAVECFHRQTWTGTKELLIVNDHPLQKIIYNHPDVTVINLPRRMKTLGEKRNLSVALAKYDNLLPWDDDDICLPWRIEETMKTLPSAQYFKCPNAWTMNNNQIEPKLAYNLFHAASAYTRWLFEKAGGYPMMNGGEDAGLEVKIQTITSKHGEFWPHTILPKNRVYYIYRWIHGSYHTTGQSNLDNIKPDITPGDVQLRPEWNLDYVKLAQIAAKE